MIKAAIFDMDGTLCDTLISINIGCNRAVERYGYSQIPANVIKSFLGDGAEMLMKKCMDYCGDDNPKHLKGAMETYDTYMNIHYNEPVVSYVGMYDTVRDMKEMGIKIAALSNKAQRALEGNCQRYYSLELFSKIVGKKEGFVRKPAPDEALKIAEELKVKPSECLFVGDGKNDILCAKAAGMISAAALWGYSTRELLESLEPDYMIENHKELIDIVAEINGQEFVDKVLNQSEE